IHRIIIPFEKNMEISHAFLQPLFNDLSTADIILRVDNIHFHSHVCVLYATSRFWNQYFKYQRAKRNNFGYINYNSIQDHEILLHDYSCSKRNFITRLHEYKGDPECEMKYTWTDFGNFLAYLYGYPMKERKKDNLYVLAHLASKNKFDWDKQHWKVTLRVSKWLGLNKLRCQVLKYVYSKGDSMFTNHVLKELNESDLKIALAISNGDDPCLLNFEVMINNDDKPELITQDDTEDDTEVIEEHDDMLIDGNMMYNKLMTNEIISDLDDQKVKMCRESSCH
ncbi:4905_t:CDS:2, partial [Dentiscutata erythropus]